MPTMKLREPDEAQNIAAPSAKSTVFAPPTIAATATVPHVFEPQLSLRTPRRVRYRTGTHLARRVMANVLAGVILGGLWLTSRDLRELSALKSRGVTATGEVYDKYETHGEDATYYLRYRYPAGATALTGRKSVRKKQYDATQLGEPFTVTYSPADPAVHRIGRVDDASIARQQGKWALGVTLITLLFGAVFALSEAGYRKGYRLLQNGVPAVGTVLQRRTVESDGTVYYVKYGFETAQGREITAETVVTKSRFDQLPEGATLTIVYDPQEPSLNWPYAFFSSVEIA